MHTPFPSLCFPFVPSASFAFLFFFWVWLSFVFRKRLKKRKKHPFTRLYILHPQLLQAASRGQWRILYDSFPLYFKRTPSGSRHICICGTHTHTHTIFAWWGRPKEKKELHQYNPTEETRRRVGRNTNLLCKQCDKTNLYLKNLIDWMWINNLSGSRIWWCTVLQKCLIWMDT